jgi:hypothetical protein
MNPLKVQLIHPGRQKPFRLGKGYIKLPDGQITIREWCNDKTKSLKPNGKPNYQHYRKFIRNEGMYVPSLNAKPKGADLLFWGEWEGYSFFDELPNNGNDKLPNGIHRLFHSTINKGGQNTDPYVYGDYFKYAVCLQKGMLTRLPPLSLVLFGTVYGNAFYLDTVFVVGSSVPASNVLTYAYSQTYREATLHQLEEYTGFNPSSEIKLYHGLTWWDRNSYFSFVPCKVNGNSGFERFRIDLGDEAFELARNTQGYSYLPNCSLSPKELWTRLARKCLQDGFVLGVQFQEPKINDVVLGQLR